MWLCSCRKLDKTPIILSRSLENAAVVYRSLAKLLRHRLPTALGFDRCILHLPRPREVNRSYIFPFNEAFRGLFCIFAYANSWVQSFTFLETMISDTSNVVKRSLRLTRLSLCPGPFDRSTVSPSAVRSPTCYLCLEFRRFCRASCARIVDGQGDRSGCPSLSSYCASSFVPYFHAV